MHKELSGFFRIVTIIGADKLSLFAQEKIGFHGTKSLEPNYRYPPYVSLLPRLTVLYV